MHTRIANGMLATKNPPKSVQKLDSQVAVVSLKSLHASSSRLLIVVWILKANG